MAINKIILLIALSALMIGFLLYWPDNKYRVVFCDVGQGDGVLVYKGFNQLLVDVGPDNKKIFSCLQKHMPFWDKKIDGVIITHWDADHSGSLENILKHYRVEKLYANNTPEKVKEQINYSANLVKNDSVKFGMMSFDILHPGNDLKVEGGSNNQESIVSLLSYGNNKILLMADATVEVEQGLVWKKELTSKVDILKLGHHGSDTATSEDLLRTVKPRLAIISVSKNNRFGHPDLDVIKRLESFGVTIRRTDMDGDIVLSLD